VSVLAHSWFAFCSADLGTFAEGREHAEEAIKIATRTESPWSKATALTCARYLHLRQGGFDTAIRTLEPALLLCRNLDLYALSVPCGGALATAYASAARLADSSEILEHTRALALSLEISGWHPLWFMLLAEAFAAGHRNDDAIELAKRVRDIAGEQGAEGYRAYALQTLGDATKAPDESAACYQAAMRIGDRLGMRPLIAHCRLGLGKLYRRAGQREQASEHLTTATTMYREMGMTYWVGQAEAEMRELA
jgi:tetratricopeptide (TPR) repeat protein